MSDVKVKRPDNTWVSIVGPAGANGSNGFNGGTWTTGSGAPSTPGVVAGDMYLNTTTSDIYRWSGSSWGSSVANIKGQTGATGAAGVNAFGAPTSRTLSLATAYQATNSAKPAMVSITLSSTANFSLTGGTTNAADILIGSTNAVASGTGTILGRYTNSVTGTIAVGLNMNSQSIQTYLLPLPIGYFFAVRQTSGTVAIAFAYDQAVG